jgi:hypothetical protein
MFSIKIEENEAILAFLLCTFIILNGLAMLKAGLKCALLQVTDIIHFQF